jgi:hypothetical protein
VVSHKYPEYTAENDAAPVVDLPNFKDCEPDYLGDISAKKAFTTLLHPDHGFAKENEGRVASLRNVELDYKLLLQRTQVKNAPISFRAARITRLFKEACRLAQSRDQLRRRLAAVAGRAQGLMAKISG